MDLNVIFKVNLIKDNYYLLVKIQANLFLIIPSKFRNNLILGNYICLFVCSEFHSGFLSTLRRSFGTKRVLANTVYCEYIKDRDHVHLNATRWVAVAGYVRWLGSQGITIF